MSRSHGGVCLYLSDKYTGTIENSYSNGVCDYLLVRIHQLNHYVAVLYRPPDTTLAEFRQMMSKLREDLSGLTTPTPDLTLMGDLNFPRKDIQWSADADSGDLYATVHNHHRTDEQDGAHVRIQAEEFLKLMQHYNMIQVIGVPTREKEILDLMFTNNHELVHHVTSEKWSTFTDHNIITITVNYATETSRLGPNDDVESCDSDISISSRYRRLYFPNAPWKEVEGALGEIDWTPMEELIPESCLMWAHEKILSVLEKLVPRRRKNCKRKHHIIPRHRRVLFKKLSKLKRALVQESVVTRIAELLGKIRAAEKELHSDYENQQWQEELGAIENIKSNPKSFFSFAKSRQKTHAKVGPFIDPITKKVNSDPAFTVEALKRQYESVFSDPKPDMVVQDPTAFFSSTERLTALTDIHFTEDDIQRACADLSSRSAAGSDGVPATLLKICRKPLSRPLLIFWRKSLDEGVIPSDLLLAVICPVHKGGSRAEPKQFRPVALTSHIIKVFERVVRRELVQYLEDNSLMSPGQHGFRALRSTLTQLLQHYDAILEDLSEGGTAVDSVYLDFSKAFDRVDHGVLFHKLRDLGIHGKLGVWIAAFLQDRYQLVAVEGQKSDLSYVRSGVPQGTVLGPVLFLILIRDIADNTTDGTRVSSFADDTRGTRAIHTQVDLSTLQHDLHIMYLWAEENNMTFNGEKFEVVRFWPNASTIKDNHCYTCPEGKPIEEKKCVKDLGVQLSTDLTFSHHIHTTIKACGALIGWVLRSFRTRSRLVMLTLWKSMIQSRLDYCSQLWSPNTASQINQLEDVQRSFTRRIAGMQNLDYWDRLKELRLYSQERRRERYAVIFIWKVARELVGGYALDFTSTMSRCGRLCRVAPVSPRAPVGVRRAMEAGLATKGAKLFNILPAEIRNIDVARVDLFKAKLDSFLSTIPDEPSIPGRGRAAESNSLLHQIPILRQQQQ